METPARDHKTTKQFLTTAKFPPKLNIITNHIELKIGPKLCYLKSRPPEQGQLPHCS